jgi:hypothetical protein
LIFFGSHIWNGETGRRYRFHAKLTNKAIPDKPGLYIFVRRRFAFFLEPLYVGKAADLRSRVIGHERWAEAYKRGATERHIMVCDGEGVRRRIEEDLIRGLKPPMNDSLVPRHERDAPNNKRLKWRWQVRNWWRFLPFFKRKAKA